MARVGVENMMMLLPQNGEGDVIIDTGVDVVTKSNLKDYVKLLENWGIKR
jgi:hypothetical protein